MSRTNTALQGDGPGLACSSCGQRNEADARHCDRCGQRLAAGLAPATPRRAALIGADASCDLRLSDTSVSSFHAVVYSEGGHARIVDLRSTNGTVVDGRVAAGAPGGLPVEHGSEISVGSARLSGAHLLAALSRAPRALLVGRDPGCDVQLDLPVVSGVHLMVLAGQAGLNAVDLGSSNGSALRASGGVAPLSISGPTAVSEADVLLLGSVRLPVAQLSARLSPTRPGDASAGEGLSLSIPLPAVGRSVVVGREAGCDLVVASPQVSARHLRITGQAGGFLVEDLGSLNGTFYGGQAVKQVSIPPRASLMVGTLPVRVDAGRGLLSVGQLKGALRLDAVGVGRVVRDRGTGAARTLVSEVSVSIYPSELVGLMGPSGAGKTTFMLALNGYEPPSSGQVLINGDDLYANFAQYRGLIGYVPQDDIMHGELTVEEALRYAARLRLPPDTTSEEIEQAVDRVIGELKLGEQRGLRIGTPEAKVLSGGQRKRVNLALELVTDPVLLFLDEPTSGLSARDTRDVMDVLRSLADGGRTLIITIHQPSREVYEAMDHVIHLARGGRLAYFGPTAPDSYSYFGLSEASPDGILDRMEGQSPEAWQARYAGSQVRETYVAKRQAKAPDREALRPEVERRSAPVPALAQGLTLFRRYARIKLRDRTNLAFVVAQAPLVGLLLGLGFHDAAEEPLKRATPIFIMAIAMIFFGCMNACREIVTERAIFRRERMVNLKIGPYLGSKFVFLAGVGGLQACVLLGLAQRWLGLEGDLPTYALLLTLTSVAATALGLLISSVVRSAEAAMAVVPILLIFQIVLSGFLIPLREEGKTYMEVLAAPMVARWSVEALFDVERAAVDEGAPLAQWKAKHMQAHNLTPERLVYDVRALLLFAVVFLGLARWRLESEGPAGG